MTRRTLPQRRHAETFELKFGANQTVFQVTLGRYANGDLGEVFISNAKAGSELDAIARDAAVLLSIAIQFGIPLDVMRHAITREASGAASTIIGTLLDRLEA